ncbi:zf-CCHC domain-containing protein/UBN2 domain-containing protein [Gossypium australe]|uniref:Zf-CCHC domain-containing protein/UBN2 domain-containing protein n=1 Tax=Gossypium australe TaxID=47621 RepID=A0A5B6VP76_9ROSI|nr:zf-CCHC domain-containing protein/UBN2 domain-containing protein [Gossypium australe]
MVRPFFKSKKEWNEEDRRSLQLNVKATHSLFCALGLDEDSRVSSCSNAKEIWDKLEVTHEGTNQVKKSKVGILTLNYETFTTKPEEDIKAMFDRFTIIINELKSYGKIYHNEVVRKMLRSLPMSWDAKVTAIKEVKNFETLSLNELIASLLTYEMKLEGVGVALKSTIEEGNFNEDVDEDEEMVMFVRRFKRFMRSNKGR